MSEIYLVTSLFASREQALPAARHLVEKKLAACVNIHDGITSVYRWEGNVQQEPEVMLSAKTTKARCQAVIDAIKRLHPYELPCIIAHSVTEGFPPFMQWVEKETNG